MEERGQRTGQEYYCDADRLLAAGDELIIDSRDVVVCVLLLVVVVTSLKSN